ncbi:hypothetical protein [Xanthomonas euvesicatoria]|uniref:hypothetical protein n=1 Tax=Xanthomonas euvesicatoria TaxID=456327 RepID=UPI001C45920A|nr:hypothetical protein [Xanthomonas euvesicatoria]MBV6849275.1 hypothetical protein [Xanthomonas campestris pv. heliotropii]
MRSAAHAPCRLRRPGNALRYIGVGTFLSAKSADLAGVLSKAGNGAVDGARGGNLESIQWLERMLEHDRTAKLLLMP